MSDRLVLDTSVLVAAVRSRHGASRVLLVDALEGRFRPLVSVPLMLEYEAVLSRKEHLRAANLSSEALGRILDAFAGQLEPVRLAFLWRPSLADAGDDMVLETAVNGRAQQLVTLNLRHFGGVKRSFGIEVLAPSAVLAARRSSK